MSTWIAAWAAVVMAAFGDGAWPPVGAAVSAAREEGFRHGQFMLPDYFEHGPATLTQPISEHSLQWPLLLRNYLWYEGDRAFVTLAVDAQLDGLLAHLRGLEDEHGLLAGTRETWTLRERPEGMGFDGEYGLVNTFYFAALRASAGLLDDLGRSGAIHWMKAAQVRTAFRDRLLDTERNLFRDTAAGRGPSLGLNAVAVCFGLTEAAETAAVLEWIRRDGLAVPGVLMPYVVEASFRGGDAAMGYRLLKELPDGAWGRNGQHREGGCAEGRPADWTARLRWCNPSGNSPMYLFGQEVLGLRPLAPGWTTVEVAPRAPEVFERGLLEVTIPGGRISAEYTRNVGLAVTIPRDMAARVDAPEGITVMVKKSLSHEQGRLSENQQAVLDRADWRARTNGGAGVWVSVEEQMLRVIRGGKVIYQARCATAEKGIGSEMNSLKTPLGWHVIRQKIGDGAPWGQVFRARQATREIWKPGDDVVEDMVLTRVLLLDGLEPGLNQGGNVDSLARHIYIHGTNDEARIGTPSSHGCVRMLNDEVIELFDLLPEGTPVLITAE